MRNVVIITLSIALVFPSLSAQTNAVTNSVFTNIQQTNTWNIRESWLWGKPFLNIFCLPIGFVSYDYADSFQDKAHGPNDYFYRGLPVPPKVISTNETNRVLVPHSLYTPSTGLSLGSEYFDMALFGIPQRLKLHFNVSQYTKDIAGEYLLPEIARLPWLLALQAYYVTYDTQVSDVTNYGEGRYPSYTTSDFGASARTGLYFFGSMSIDIGASISLYQYQQSEMQYASTNGAQYIPIASRLTVYKQEGDTFRWESPWYFSFAPEFNFTYDTRNNYMYPNNGMKLGLDVALSFGAYSHVSINAQFMWAIPIWSTSIHIRSQFMTVLPNPFVQSLSNYYPDSIAAAFNVRGWSVLEYESFGFLVEDLINGHNYMISSGNNMFLLSFEYNIPLITDVLGTYCFLDSGQTIFDPGMIATIGDLRQMRFSVGLGLRLLMPFFPFDVALVKKFIFNGSGFFDPADETGPYFLGRVASFLDWPFLGRGWKLIFSITRAF
ncbi:MAG: BamA/TamA family outer membrane protein [Spirochaetota bacterium]